MEKPTTMRVFLTGPNPSLLVAPGRICDVVWRRIQRDFPDHVGVFFGLPQDQVVGRMIPLSRGPASAVNFGALCESAKPDVVISLGDDSDAAHVAATLMVGLASSSGYISSLIRRGMARGLTSQSSMLMS